jgi:Cof subfamily protein (haloacid dehalogenase superfamily)
MLRTSTATRCRAVATDLDGTLLRSDGEISDFTTETLRDVTDQGILLVLVTARPIEATRRIATQLHAGVAICLSGAVTYDVMQGRIGDIAPLRPPQVRLLRDEIRGVCKRIAWGYETLQGRHVDPSWNRVDSGLSKERLTCLLTNSKCPKGDILSVLASCNVHDASCLQDWMAHAGRRWGTAFSPVKGIVEITTPTATKASALSRLCESRSIHSKEVVALGDSLNDLAMLTWAGTSVAVANGHKQLRQIATVNALSNDSDGVAHTLRSLLCDQVEFSSSMTSSSSRLHHNGVMSPA